MTHYQKIIIFDFNNTLEFHEQSCFSKGLHFLANELNVDISQLQTYAKKYHDEVISRQSDDQTVSFFDELAYFMDKFSIRQSDMNYDELEYQFFMAVKSPTIPPIIYEELKSLLSHLKEWGYTLHIMSNTFYSAQCIRTFLNSYQIGQYFNKILTSGDIKSRKPSPNIIKELKKNVGFDSLERAFLIGDKLTTDQVSAEQNKMIPLIVDFAHQGISSFHSYRQIEQYFRKNYMVISGISHQLSTVDGPGHRTVLFTQGCPHQCEGCHNPQTFDMKNGQLYSVDDLADYLITKSITKRITISGGEPLIQVDALDKLLGKLEGFDLCLYTGNEIEEVPHQILKHLHYIKVGKYIRALAASEEPYIGSSNQLFIDLKEMRQ